jgi:hypothetical protein
MKKIVYLFLSMLLIISSYGCKEDENIILKTHLYYYNIAIAFENQSGENLVEGIPYDESSNSILNTEYKQTISVAPEFGSKPHHYTVNEPGIWKDENGEENFFFTATMYSYVYPMVTQKLVCPYIFGDNNEHILVSYWEDLPDYKYKCTGFTLDGKEYPIVKEGVLEYKDGIGGDLYKVKIVLE